MWANCKNIVLKSRYNLLIWFTIMALVIVPFCNSYADHTSANNYTGLWSNSASWSPSWVSPSTSLSEDITIYGYISVIGDLSFGGSGGVLTVNDTLVVYGNLSLGNNCDLNVASGGVLMVLGNLSIGNKTDIATNSYIVTTGNFTANGSQSTFNTSLPSKVYIFGSAESVDGNVTNCPSNCHYGNSSALLSDQIVDFYYYVISGYVSGIFATITIGEKTGNLNLNNYHGNIKKWQKRLNGGSWIDIVFTGNTYEDLPTESGTWEYRSVVNNGTIDANSKSKVVVVKPIVKVNTKKDIKWNGVPIIKWNGKNKTTI